MSTSVYRESTLIPPETQSNSIDANNQIEIEFAKCDSCGITEECTPEYIATIRGRYQGKWICGLCAEAVNDEIFRSERFISEEEALIRHMNFCLKFRSAIMDPKEDFICVFRRLFRRMLDAPRVSISTPNSPRRDQIPPSSLTRSGSCFPDL